VLAEHPQRRCAAAAAQRLACAVLARLEFEADLAVRLSYQIRREWAPRARGDELQQIGLAGGEQLLHLLALDRALQDHPAGAKIAGLACADGFFAHVGRGQGEHARAAFRTGAQRFEGAEIGRFAVGPLAGPIAEIELDFVGIVELERR
jgi:hypothetical protein